VRRLERVCLDQGMPVQSVDEFLADRFVGCPRALDYYAGLWRAYEPSRLADPHFTREITSGDDGCFWSRVWEMVLYRHLTGLTSDITGHNVGSGRP